MMTSSDGCKSSENMDSTNEVLLLDQPCEYCKVLELNDTLHGGVAQEAGGKRFVQFKSIVVNERDPEYQLSLGYRREDILPGLPNIAATAQTCAFCRMLRSDLRFSYRKLKKPRVNDFNGTAHGEEDGNHAIQNAKIMITDVNYLYNHIRYGSPDYWDDDDDDGESRPPNHSDVYDWLNILIVYVEIDWGFHNAKYSLQYQVYADACDPCRSWLRIRRKPISNDFISTRSLSRLHELIDKSLCDASDPAQGTFLPTRLIDVGANNSTKLRLIISKDDEDVREEADPVKQRYLALSYCWGSKEKSEKQLKTTADSLSKHLSQIDIHEMPQTIADAVHACRALGVRYLWVDALCIIQGDGDDWARESLQMAKVYSSSFLTLCILQGSSCLGGFLRTKWSRPTLQVKFRSEIDTSISGVVHIRMLDPARLIPRRQGKYPPETFEKHTVDDMKHTPWNSRGWTFQEALLSSRNVFFQKHIFSYAWGDQHILADGFRLLHDEFLSSSKLTPNDQIRGWYKSMQDYSKRRLTYETDKFPAISALAKLISEENPGQEYLAGLWKSDLHRGLLWSPFLKRNVQDVLEPCSHGYRFKHVSQEYIAPSWSWASCPGPVNWLGEINGRLPADSAFFPEYRLLNAEVVAADRTNLYGRVSSACLELEAKLLRVPLGGDGKAKVVKNADTEKTYTFGFLYLNTTHAFLSPSDEYVANFSLDWDSPSLGISDSANEPVEQMWMMLTSSIQHKKPLENQSRGFAPGENCLGLLLLPTENEREFIKVGIWLYHLYKHQGKRQWEGIQPQSIRIV